MRCVLVTDPARIHEALVDKSDALIIRGGFSRGRSRLIGGGILTNHGARWQHSRSSLQPLFRHEALAASAPALVARVDAAVARWL